ncbi:MFS transporter [Herbaspirillum sp. RTI4]|uniref:MFS transporter n=1 Tax=Herbaspirillum sp. RTI4 TaxID=3048640 RepID=UPI002AB39222|nr:MFS transporter [Herbaspirillum sp. RTI4]MDY7577563.1 MFS transporter [Herbaspirillum sp. RTI4]MEA9981038.1 MFS transporter [Herbaspirillum sp. RTI4]
MPSNTVSSAPATLSPNAVTFQILSTVALTFICYLIVGLPMAVLPGYVHVDLGYSSFIAGIAISVQYVATLLTRPQAGRLADSIGAKRSVLYGLTGCGISGVFLFLASLAQSMQGLSLLFLLCSRLALGLGESLVGTGAIMWGIGRIGSGHTTRMISWNGIANYGALAVGAPLGVALEHYFGLLSIGILIVLLALGGFLWAWVKQAVPAVHGERMGFRQVFSYVMPYGAGLALGTVGFGIIATFVTLYYASHQWSNAALALSLFGLSFVAARLLFAQSIHRHGGFRVAIAAFTVETFGLLLLWWAPGPAVAMLGAAISGLGFSMVFPSLGTEAVCHVAPANRGAALGTFTVFLDVALAVVGPLAGLVVGGYGYDAIFLVGAAAALIGVLLTLVLYRNDLRRNSR